MRFDGRLVSQIDPQEIIDLVNNKVREDEGLDFKREPYGAIQSKDPKNADDKKTELCCDVAAFANASGGYIIIGIDDKGNRASGWRTITNPEPYISSIQSVCFDGIEPRLEELDVGPIAIPGEESVIVIRVPPGAEKPYMVKRNHATHFCQRRGDDKREMARRDIRAAFLGDRVLQRLIQMDAKLDMLLSSATPGPIAELGADTDALNAKAPEQVLAIMEARLRKLAEAEE